MNGMPFQYTRGAMNNRLAAGDRAAAQRVDAGRGLSRGRGQQFMQSMRGGEAQANAFSGAMDIASNDRFDDANQSLGFSRMAESRRRGDWDSRFGNLTSIWGALSGLLQ
jgi:hypothetical protein